MKHLMASATLLLLAACSTTPPATPGTPATTPPTTSPSVTPAAQSPNQFASTAPSTPSGLRPGTAAPSTTPASTPPSSAPLPVAPASTTPVATTPATPPETTAPRTVVTTNYSTETVLAGLKSESDYAQVAGIATKYNLKVDRYLTGIRTVIFLTQGQPVPDLVNQLAQEPIFAYVESDQVSAQKPNEERPADAPSFSLFNVPLVNDTFFSTQYGLKAIKAPESWALANGEGITVAVIDSGVAFGHKDLKNQVLPGYDAYPRKAGNKGGDVSSLNYLMPTYKHGSHVAGIIAAATDNNEGIAGVAPKAKILPVNIFPGVGDIIKSVFAPEENTSETLISIIADGVVWAADHGAHVINMSLAVTEPSNTLERAVQYALEKNVTVVVAAGNERMANNARNYLAAIPGVIGVGATDRDNNVTAFSNSGDYVSVAAPGYMITSTVPSFLRFNPYVEMSGTSMAAPHVAGVAALMRQKFGAQATPAWIKQRLEETAIDRGEPGRDDLYGHGLVDTYQALQ